LISNVFFNPDETEVLNSMTPRVTQTSAQGKDMANALRSWVMVALTLVFLLLYGAAIVGWLKPLADEKMVARLEPIIFVIIGYYFGRLPSQQNESTLKDEISRQTQRADAAHHAKEQVQQAREALEEKLKNIRTTLTSSPGGTLKALADGPDKSGAAAKEDALRQSIAGALNILNS
jgi:hypothetical protein